MSKIIKYQLPKVSIDVLLKHENDLINFIKDKGGIYLLYKNDDIYYVGRAVNLKRRIKQHIKDHHKNRWDAFALCITNSISAVPAVERILISLLKPVGNNLLYEGEIRRAERELKKAIMLSHKENTDFLFRKEKSKKKKKHKIKKIKFTKKNRLIKKEYNGKKYRVLALANGMFKFKNKRYSSLTLVAKKITGTKHAISGPRFFGLN